MKRIISMLAATAAIVSCEMEINQLPVEPTDDLVTINAVSADTKTVLDGAQVLWENDDQIKVVISGTQRYEHIFTTTLENTSATAKFKGVLTDEFKSDASLNETGYAIYPSDVEIDAGYIYHEILAEQDGYIAPGQNLSYSVINTEDLKNGSADAEFKNLYSLIKVTVPEGITKVTLSSDKPLAGRIPFAFAANAVSINETKWASMEESTKVKKVQLLPDASTLEAGKVYDLVVFPGQHELTVRMENSESEYFEKTVNMTLAASKYYTLDFTKIFSLSATEFVASPFGGGTIEIPFVTSSPESEYTVTFDFNGEDEWLSVQPDSKGAGVTESSITLAVATGENNSADRTAEVTIKEVASNKSVTVSVTQKYVELNLLGEYVETYVRGYGYATQTGSFEIKRTDDISKGVYLVDGILGGQKVYADYVVGTLTCYDNGYERNLTVSNSYQISVNKGLQIGTMSIDPYNGKYSAVKKQGAPELTAEEEALVGMYNEAWKYQQSYGSAIEDVSATNGMTIAASDEAAFGRLKVTFLSKGGSFACYANLDGSSLQILSNGATHATYGTAQEDITMSVSGETLSFSSLPVAVGYNYGTISDYSATKVEIAGGAVTAEKLIGTWHEDFVAGGPYTSNIMTISLTDDPSKGQLKVKMFNYSTYSLTCYANLEGTTLTVLTSGVDFAGMGPFTENMEMTVISATNIVYNSTINTGYGMPVGSLNATKISD